MAVNRKDSLISFTWGLSEAIFLFFVPDIWLSYLALNNKNNILHHVFLATFGAIIGGTIIYILGNFYFEELELFFNKIPAISKDMIEKSGNEIEEKGLFVSLFWGALYGIPYKLYALWAGFLKLSYLNFILSSILIRTLRFSAVITLTIACSKIITKSIGKKYLYDVHIICWVTFYLFYFSKTGL